MRLKNMGDDFLEGNLVPEDDDDSFLEELELDE